MLWFAGPVASAQPRAAAAFQYLGKEEGLSQSSVMAIAQDSTGLMWFGTRDGLNKYDGTRFVVYRHDGSPAGPFGNDVRVLYVDPLHRQLWVGTQSGLSRYNPRLDRFDHYTFEEDNPRSLPGEVIRDVFRDASGRLWVCTSTGLARYDAGKDDFERFFPASKGDKDVRFVRQADDGRLFVGTNGGLYVLGAGAGAKFVEEPAFAGFTLTCARWATGEGLWMGTVGEGLWLWPVGGNAPRQFTYQPDRPASLSNATVRALAVDEQDSTLWVGTYQGLNHLSADRTAFTRHRAAATGQGRLRNESIRALSLDRAGSLWIGTFYGGVHHLDDRYNTFTNYQARPHQNSIRGSVVSSFAEGPSGNLWVGTEGGGLSYLDRSTGVFTNYTTENSGLSDDNIKFLHRDGGGLWIGTFRGGLSHYNPGSGDWATIAANGSDGKGLSHRSVYGVLRRDDKLWIATYGGGLNVLNLATNTVHYYNGEPGPAPRIPSDLLRVVFAGRAGEVWIGSNDGLIRTITGPDGMPKRFELFLPGRRVYCLMAGPGEQLYVGTFNNGLYVVDTKTGETRNYRTADGLPSEAVFGLLPAPDGAVWISTGNGLSRFKPSTQTFTNYDDSHGLANLEFNFNAYLRTSDGRMWFGGLRGFTSFQPADIRANTFDAPVIFTGLRHNNAPVAIGGENGLLDSSLDSTEELTFNYNEANFTIDFAALDYFSPENNRYAYRLLGVDQNWRYATGRGRASYTLQREGQYTFEATGANSDGAWGSQVRRLSITVLPPPWRTWWAYLLYAALLCLTGVVAYRMLRLRHQVQLQAAAQRQQDELLETKLRFFTNITHEFRTPLTLIIGPLRQLLAHGELPSEATRQLSLVERNAQRLRNLVNQILTFRRLATDHENMEVRKQDLPTFLRKLFEQFEGEAARRRIAYQFRAPPGPVTVWFDADKLEKVFVNLLSNAFKFTPDGGRIVLAIEERATDVSIRVADTGRGIDSSLRTQVFKRFYEKSAGSPSTLKSSGIGLAISQQMIDLHRGSIEVLDPEPGSVHTGANFVVTLQKGAGHFTEVELNTTQTPTATALACVEGEAPPPSAPPFTSRATYPADGGTSKGSAIRNWPEADSGPDSALAPAGTPQGESQETVTLLIVEDNAEIREYISEIFTRESYRVVTAPDGEQGLARARTEMPQLIISDVMMPNVGGLEFCAAVKADLRISHIPVILLTARTAEPFRLEGLRTGADDYVTKPFLPEELRLRVKNILAGRAIAREKFARVVSLEPTEIAVTGPDEEFLQNALRTVEEQMDNVDFKVEQFADSLAVSRSLLFTKVKALTGQTPNNFIKTVRLKRAAQLVATGKLNVAEVAYKTGFRDPKYFTKCFKAQFGVTPTEYDTDSVTE